MKSHRHLLPQLLPPVSYDASGVLLSAEITSEGNCLDGVTLKAKTVVGAITPHRAGDLIVDWERLLGLKATSDSYQMRLRNVLLKIAETGGLSIPYFINLAAQLGFEININELSPFYADINAAGDSVSAEDVIFTWQVVIKNRTDSFNAFAFRADASTAGESLLMFGDPVIEQVFEDLKPAHTFVYFAYKDSNNAKNIN